MKINGNNIILDGDEVATAIDAYLTAHSICVDGPRTIIIAGRTPTPAARVYVDPSGRIVDNRSDR